MVDGGEVVTKRGCESLGIMGGESEMEGKVMNYDVISHWLILAEPKEICTALHCCSYVFSSLELLISTVEAWLNLCMLYCAADVTYYLTFFLCNFLKYSNDLSYSMSKRLELDREFFFPGAG